MPPSPSSPDPGPDRRGDGLDWDRLRETVLDHLASAGRGMPEVAGFHLLELVGTGSAGRVFQARDLGTGDTVALKIAHDGSMERMERMKSEWEALRLLIHPHIIACRQLGMTKEGIPWLTMDFLPGTNLAGMLPAGGFSFDETMALLRPVLDAVTYAHSRGVLHRDLKPSNILIGTDGSVKVVDFGLARPLEQRILTFSLTRSGTIAGTAEYLAPECYLADSQPSVAAEVYALGVILYEMLSGSPPRGAWQPVSHRKKIDVRVDQVIRCALAADPAQRFASAADMNAALGQIALSPRRFAGAALLTPGARAADGLWTLLGLLTLSMTLTSILRLGSTRITGLPLDFFEGVSRGIGAFTTFTVLAPVLGFASFLQALRMWHFRHVPLRERLPMPCGLSLGHSRVAGMLAALGQILFLFLPLVCLHELWESLVWHPVPAPHSSLFISTSYWTIQPASIWRFDPAEFLDGNSVWIVDAMTDSNGRLTKLLSKASFFPIIEPLLLGTSIVVSLAVFLWTMLLCGRWLKQPTARLIPGRQR